MTIELICLDADDTLWHNMRHFDAAEQALFAILEPFAASPAVRERLEAVGARNLALYGYGVKSFTLSMLETATELAGDALPPAGVRDILAIGRDLLRHPVELLPGVEATLDALAGRARLVLITKGDLLHQEAKLAASGLGQRFTGIEIVSDKTANSFRRLFARHAVAPERCAWRVTRSAPTFCPRSRPAPGPPWCRTTLSGSTNAPSRRHSIPASRTWRNSPTSPPGSTRSHSH
jgi:putative hydrolase of the HAD superfamily